MSAAIDTATALPRRWRDLVDLGFSVIPVEHGGKLPLGKWKASQHAHASLDTIAQWAARETNIGIVTGAISGLIVLDTDSAEAIAEVERRGIPDTVTVETAKGRHYYFRHPGGTIGNRAGLLPGVDIRGDGGFVVAPGSIHPSGHRYRWGNPPGLFDLAPPPQWLLDLLAKPETKPAEPTSIASSAYGERAIDNELSALRRANEGERNDALNRAAFNLAQLAAGGVIGEENTKAHLRATAAAIGLEPGEIDATIESGWKAGSEHPRRPEPLGERASARFQHGAAWSEAHDPETGEVLDRPNVEPVDLWRRYSTPELPEGLLPATIEAFARNHGEVMGVDPAGLAMAALAVSAAAITDDIKVQVKRHDPTWRESARLWVGLVGSPSMKKTPVISAAIRPLRRIDANLMRTYSEALAKYEAIPPKDRKAAQRPKQERRIIADATIEAAQEVLRDTPRGVLSVQDELSGWFGTMDKYAPGKGAMADRGFWLQAYNGGAYSLNRISRGAAYIPNCSIGLLGGIQPEPIRAIAGDTHDDGLVQRLLPVILRPGAVGHDKPADGAVEAYERLIERLDLMRPPMRAGFIPSDDGPLPLRFDERARSVRERLEVEHLELVRALETVSPKLAAHFGKYDGLFARLCLIWHCVEAEGVQPAEEISGHTAERVARFMAEFIRPSAIAFYAGLLGLSAGHEDLLALASWIVAANITEVKARDVQSSSQSFRHVTADQVRTLCEKLEAFGWGEWAEPGPKSNKPRFLVNPLVHERFALRGEEEQARRATVREAIKQALGG